MLCPLKGDKSLSRQGLLKQPHKQVSLSSVKKKIIIRRIAINKAFLSICPFKYDDIVNNFVNVLYRLYVRNV